MSNEHLPIIPETQLVEPIAQYGVLYLGTTRTSSVGHGLDSIQEPFSHRYPIDGTNTARGIDSILSIYPNGIQLSFPRHPYAVVFYPISSLIYCASLRFSIIKNEQSSSLDWRFLTLDTDKQNPSTKHPPLFALVTQRTKTIAGNECHCFITKNDDATLSLVRTISDVYAKLKSNLPMIRSPIYYQLDRYGRKLSETNGLIYLSSDNNDNALVDGYFYRTDGILIEQWQLWDDNVDDENRNISRPHPPDSPFGLHQGIYHDDIQEEFNEHLRFINDEEEEDYDDEHSRLSKKHCHHRHHHRKPRFLSTYAPSSHSSFDPPLIQKRNVPIVIEKILPQTISVQKPNEEIIEEKDQTIVNDNHHHHHQHHRKKRSKHIPIIDLQTIENRLETAQSNILDVLDGYFENSKGEKLKLDGHEAQALIDELEQLTAKKKHSKITSSRTTSYVERPSSVSNSNEPSQPIEPNSNYISVFRYMQSSVNPQFFQQYQMTYPTD